MEDQTRTIVQDFIHMKLAKNGIVTHNDNNRTVNPVATTMGTLTEEFERRYEEVFERMTKSLNIGDDRQSAQSIFQSVVDDLFSDGIAWGRIVAMFSFAGSIAATYPNLAEDVMTGLTIYITTNLLPWIIARGGWVRIDYSAIQQ